MNKNLLTILIIISLLLNCFFAFRYLKGEVYNVGFRQGQKALSQAVVNEIEKTGQISVKTDRGTIVLIAIGDDSN